MAEKQTVLDAMRDSDLVDVVAVGLTSAGTLRLFGTLPTPASQELFAHAAKLLEEPDDRRTLQ